MRDDSKKLVRPQSDDGRYRLLVEAVTDYAICMLDADGIVSSWNPGAERLKGYSAAEIIGQHFTRFYTDEDRAAGLPARALQTARDEGKFETEGWRVRKDGSRFWAYVVIHPVRAGDGMLVGFAKITRDLTERRQAEDTLRRSEEQFRLLVHGVTDYAIYLLDPGGFVSSWNPGAQRIKGYLPHEIVGQHFSRFYTEEDRAAGLPERALSVAAREGRFEREGVRLRKDGSRFFAHVIIDAIRDDDGRLAGFAKITRDITERREAQEKLERTREALVQAQKMEAIGQLTGGVAHDFNNLLMAVLGSLELMRKRLPDDPRLKSLLENAVKGAERGAALTKRMLAFARRQEIKQESIDIPNLVRGMTELLQRTLGKSITLETRFPLALSTVIADANQLEIALLNLAVNARDAMSDDGEIVISARDEVVGSGQPLLKPGRYVRLSVSDNGAGMDETTLRRAVEPFFTTKQPGKGTGLGLSMVHGLAEQFGGGFVLRSRVGEGTTAELWLPADETAAHTAEPAPRTEKDVPAQPKLAVLAVDDDPLVLTNTVAMLEDLGHVCFAAASADEALAILEAQNGIDLVVTDQVMPHATGLQLAKTIRKRWPELPIMLATGYAEIGPEQAMKLPRLSKPFTQAELAAEIAGLGLRSRKGAGAQVINFRGGNGDKAHNGA